MTPEHPSDTALQALRTALASSSTETVVLSRSDAEWLLAEIEGGREAFSVVVGQKRESETKLADLRRNHEWLLQQGR